MVNKILVSEGWPKSSKYHNRIEEYVYEMVQNAKQEILISCYLFYDDDLAKQIEKKSDEQLRIRIVLDKYVKGRKTHKRFFRLAKNKNNNFGLYLHSKKRENLLHTKLIVTDSTYNHARACVGSSNFTKKAFQKNIELAIGMTGKTAMDLGTMFRKELLKSNNIKEVK